MVEKNIEFSVINKERKEGKRERLMADLKPLMKREDPEYNIKLRIDSLKTKIRECDEWLRMCGEAHEAEDLQKHEPLEYNKLMLKPVYALAILGSMLKEVRGRNFIVFPKHPYESRMPINTYRPLSVEREFHYLKEYLAIESCHVYEFDEP